MSDRLAEIREHAESEHGQWQEAPVSYEEVAWLIAEVERLRAAPHEHCLLLGDVCVREN
jgi:hypothetical protein